MRQGFVRCAAMIPNIKVADCSTNEQEIKRLMDLAADNDAHIVVFPELCLTGYTCQDLFLQDALLNAARESLISLAAYTTGKNFIAYVGLPYMHNGKLYNVAAALCNGKILGLCPKTHIPNYSEFYEVRHFNVAPLSTCITNIPGYGTVPFGTKLLYNCISIPNLVIAAEICEDVWVSCPPSVNHSLAGATLIVNCSASDETTGKDVYRRNLISAQSAAQICAYVYCNAGDGESTQDLVFGGHSIIAENGTLLAEARRFQNESIFADIDLGRIASERRRITTCNISADNKDYQSINFDLKVNNLQLNRYYSQTPFVPSDKSDRDARCEEILTIQAMGLKKRLLHTNCKSSVIGISGGLDSTLALLVTAKAYDMLGRDRTDIIAVTMPCFGTTDRTYQNACKLVKSLNATLIEVNISDSVNKHFEDIGHDSSVHDVTYENCQARERTQVLMDIANKYCGIVIGTGDLSELALGWATYNGDHMSMYGVNCSIPKTLVRHLVRYYADTANVSTLNAVLLDVLATPVSPELLPPVEGVISQKTEDIVGPYELHDFFLYYVLRFGYMPSKIYRIACHAFANSYTKEIILNWLKIFYRRFFAQQFKRSCLPDGPKVGSVAISPRGDLRMPSDAMVDVWEKDLTNI